MSNRFFAVALAVLISGWASASPFPATDVAVTPPVSHTTFRPAGVRPDVSVAGFETVGGTPTRYYVLGKSNVTSPRLVVFVPGSGCDGAFTAGTDGRAKAGPEAFALKYADQATVVALEPPGVPRQFAAPVHGLSEGCPATFLQQSDFSHLIASYKTAVDDVIASANRPIDAIMFVGVSDGAVTAAALAGEYQQTSHIVLVSGFGSDQVTGQMDDLVGSVLNAPKDAAARAAVATYASRLISIRARPSETAIWQGQSETHWASTFGKASSAEVAGLAPRVKTLLVQGGADTSWPVANFRRGLAELLVAGRSAWIQYIPCADHNLICPNDGGAPKNLAGVVDAAMQWFVKGEPSASWDRLPPSR